MSNSEDKDALKKKPKLQIVQSDVENILKALQSTPHDLFLLDAARYVLGKRRYEAAIQNSDLAVTEDEKELWSDAIDLAKKGTLGFQCSRTYQQIDPPDGGYR